MRPAPTRSRSRGTSLIEVLVAMAILSLVTVGMLSLWGVALAQSRGSHARSQLTYKCQQVVEIIRISQYLVKQGQPAFAQAYKIGDPATGTLSAATNVGLPYVKTDPGWKSTPAGLGWGPSGANIVEQEFDAYRLFYNVQAVPAPATSGWTVCVTALPVGSPDMPAGLVPAPNPNIKPYMGNANLKRVDYVAQIP